MSYSDNKAPGDSNTATTKVFNLVEYLQSKGLAHVVAVVGNNHQPIFGQFSAEETVALGGLLDKLDALERAIRVRPNARALAALRESVEIDLALDGEPETRMAAHAAGILLDMFDKIAAVPA